MVVILKRVNGTASSLFILDSCFVDPESEI
jgi:hypothetical protein